MFGEANNPFQFDFEKPDKDLIDDLLVQTQAFLRTLVFHDKPFGHDIKFVGEARNYTQKAFGEEEVGEFDKLIMSCRENVAKVNPENLSEAGLIGNMLRAKLYLLVSWGEKFVAGVWRAIKYLFKVLNAILGSIQSALGLKDAIKEAKDLVANGLDYIDKEAPESN
ncbi:hypothetical protein [Primorskyibacter sp. S87]|uniref:hypothetical protein n=1 Tax=Primorskyibacter sp. S87 TaxID=3415126 RepID=UPI003C7A2815